MNKITHRIATVAPGSIAEELELAPGDVILAINDQEIEDIFDYHYLVEDEYLVMLVEKPDGLDRVVIGGGALGVDQHQDQVRNPGAGLLEINIHELKGRDLRGGGNVIVLCHQGIEALIIKVHTAGIAFAAQGDGERDHGYVMLLLIGSGNVAGGIAHDLDLAHRSAFLLDISKFKSIFVPT